MKAGILYATREYHRRPLPIGLAGVVTGVSPACPYGVALLPMEGERWILTLAGFSDDVPPLDVAGFDAFAKRFPIEDVHDFVDHAPPLTEPKRYRVPVSVRRRYERLRRLPDGYLAVGEVDASVSLAFLVPAAGSRSRSAVPSLELSGHRGQRGPEVG